MTITSLAEFFGWCTIINAALLIFASLSIVATRGWMTGIHSKLMGVSESELAGHYFRYLANYKIGIFLFSLVPYVALKLMG